MEYEKIKQLMEDMGNSKLTDIDIEFPDGTKISMKKQTIIGETSRENFVEQNLLIANCSQNEKNAGEIVDLPQTEQEKGNIVKSPMVGTFYIKPSPTSEPYVEVGKEVKKGDTLCIIEAMKLMNEIESEFSGRIIEILVKDGEPVEYGTPIFIIK